jgi:hypothetical protein
MVNPNVNSTWTQARQNQQKQQRQRQRPRQQQQVKDDFGDEWLNRDAAVVMAEGGNIATYKVRIVGISRYWLKVSINDQITYLNKASILRITPVEMRSGPGGDGNEKMQQSR